MADPKSTRPALTHALAMALAGAGTWLLGHAVSPAQASQPVSGLATSAQVEALSSQLAEYRAEVKLLHNRTSKLEEWKIASDAIQEERERVGTTRNAVGRGR